MKNISLENLETFAAQLEARYGKKTDIPTAVSALANDAKYQTEQQVADAINTKLSSAYKAGGSVAFEALPGADEAHLGFVYNITGKFTTTDAFVEGAGQKHPAGTNVVIVAVVDGEETSYKFDVLAGFVDLSGYPTNQDLADGLAGCVKTADVETVTEAEILALFPEA